MKVLKNIIKLRYFVILFVVLSFSCSKTDNIENEIKEEIEGVEPIENLELSYEIFKDIQTTYFENNQVISTIGYYENNKRVLDSVFDENNQFWLKIDRYYNAEGLTNRIVQYASISDTIADKLIDYENGKISNMSQYRKLTNGDVNSANTIVTYSSSTILLEIEQNPEHGNLEVLYSLNSEGKIYQEARGPQFIEVSYSGGLLETKSYSYNESFVEQETFQYLQEPIPIGPWKSRMENQVGNFNNQIISSFVGGLYSIDIIVDHEKYIESFADFNFSYNFNDAGFPIRIEKVNAEYKFIDIIEYKKM